MYRIPLIFSILPLSMVLMQLVDNEQPFSTATDYKFRRRTWAYRQRSEWTTHDIDPSCILGYVVDVY